MAHYRIFPVKIFRAAVIGMFVEPWKAWNPSFPKECNDLHATYFSTAGINILTDLAILLMPLSLLMKLNLHDRRKYALIAIFMIGAFASAASIVRLNALYRYTITGDVFYDAIQILLWSQIEVNIAIISASTPSLRPMFPSIFKSSSYDRSYNYRNQSNNIYVAMVVAMTLGGQTTADL
ncbi:hypothetical protein N7532_003210 [Penicillium argentinense]|uniref:Rhodopsin domain-containing protein n=1 Tax=Penicillium argentinense TaxID=1131581 RepID=A0A9W9FM10_9EURO|nr:uncharacterized protein N7532_003210 [Penicillium argentinense]KAJ5102681.1 hypothetical protein N7532_003210 [Penicillium argentinense]